MKMKRCFLLLLSCFIYMSVSGQDNGDRFASYQDMVGHEVMLYNLGDGAWMLDGIAFDANFDRMKKDDLEQFQGVLTVRGITTHDGKRYLVVSSGASRIMMMNILLGDKYDVLVNSRSVTYWNGKLENAKRYRYISLDSDLLETVLNKADFIGRMSPSDLYLPVSFADSFSMPAFLDEDVVFTMSLPDRKEVRFKAKDFDFFEKDFRTENASDADEVSSRTFAEHCSVMDKVRVYPAFVSRSDVPSWALDNVHADYTFYDDADYRDNYYDKEIPFAVYSVEGKSCKGILGSVDVTVPSDAVRFRQSDDGAYLAGRGSQGAAARKTAAVKYDGAFMQDFLYGHQLRSATYHSHIASAEAYMSRGNYDEAVRRFDAALSLRPGNKDAKDRLEDAERKLKNAREEAVRRRNLVNKYGSYWGELVYQKKYTLGMTTEMCSDIAGKGSYRVSRSIDNFYHRTVEYWEYDSAAAYAVGGLLLGELGLMAAAVDEYSHPDLKFVDGKLVEIRYE